MYYKIIYMSIVYCRSAIQYRCIMHKFFIKSVIILHIYWWGVENDG